MASGESSLTSMGLLFTFLGSLQVIWLNLFFRTLQGTCENAQTLIIAQMNAWDNDDCGTKPGDTEPHGQKCLYHVSWHLSYKELISL